jgi:hypothetical protein
LEKLTGKEFVDTSAAQTVQQCFALNQYSKGVRLAKDLNMSEKLLWSLKVNGLAEGHDWRELEKLSKEKKVPIRPYAPPTSSLPLLPARSRAHSTEGVYMWRTGAADRAGGVCRGLHRARPDG